MPKAIHLSICCLLFLSGCQIQSLKQGSKADDATVSCRISPAHLYELQEKEGQFLSTPDQRSRIMLNAIRSKDSALLALLLSTPLSSAEQLQQAKRHYAKLVLFPHETCPGDRYLDVRNQYTSALQWMRAEQDNLLTENKALQLKIDALTQIESDLNEEREGPQ